MSTKLKAGTATSGAVIDADTTGILELQTGSTPTTAVTIDASQNVGIGTASPTGKTTINYNANSAYNTGLSVYNASSGSSATVSFQLTNDAANRAGAYLTSSTCAFYGGANTFNLGTVESIPFTFLTGNSERMRIDTSGNLLVGTTSKSFGAVGSNQFMVKSGSADSLTVWNTGTGGSVGLWRLDNVSGSGFFHIFTYGTTTVGTITTNGSTVSYNTSSDYRLKENIAPMQNALNVVQQLKPVTYNWKSDGSEGQGFIAHELAEVCPDAVTGEKDAVNEDGSIKPQGIDTSFLVATLTAAIQELNAKVEALEAQLGAK